MHRIFIPLVLLLVWPSAFAASPGEEIRVIPLKHRTAQEVLPIIRPLLDPNASVSGTDYRLLIRTSPKNLEEIGRVLAQLDVARSNLTLTARLVAAADAARVLRELKGEIQAGGETRIRLPRHTPDDDGSTIGRNTSDDSLRYRTKRRAETRHNDLLQVLQIQDGQRAFVRVGQSVPHMTAIKRFSGTAPAISQAVEFQNITTGFDVLPQLQGDRVHLAVTPRVVSLDSLATGLANIQELTTTVVVKPGEWIDMGQIIGNGDEMRQAILESAESTTGERRTILLKVELKQ